MIKWVTLLSMLFKAIADQFGWFGIVAAREYSRSIKPLVGQGEVPAVAAQSPDELKRVIVEFLNGLADRVPGVFPRLVLRQVISAVPALLDYLWDQLFDQGLVRMPFRQTGVMEASGGSVEPPSEVPQEIRSACIESLDSDSLSNSHGDGSPESFQGGKPETPSTQPANPMTFRRQPQAGTAAPAPGQPGTGGNGGGGEKAPGPENAPQAKPQGPQKGTASPPAKPVESEQAPGPKKGQ